MLKILLCGALGKLGKSFLELPQDDFEIVCGVDVAKENSRIPLYVTYDDVQEKPNVVIDFSSPSALVSTLRFATQRGIGAVVGTTGLTDDDFSLLRRASRKIPIFYASNFSSSVFLLQRLAVLAKSFLVSEDVYIIEKHRAEKRDVPSGTAKTLQKSLSLPNSAVLSLRGGSCPGEHEIVFFGEGETLVLTHRAENRSLFAKGAIRAARFLQDKPYGLFGMNDLFS